MSDRLPPVEAVLRTPETSPCGPRETVEGLDASPRQRGIFENGLTVVQSCYIEQEGMFMFPELSTEKQSYETALIGGKPHRMGIAATLRLTFADKESGPGLFLRLIGALIHLLASLSRSPFPEELPDILKPDYTSQ